MKRKYKKIKRMALLDLLMDKGLFEDRKEAKSCIMLGKVLVNSQRVDKSGQLIPENAVITIKRKNKFVSRGGIKLEGALYDFDVDVAGKIILDAGASTGGFTDCLLQHGAKRVYSVDVGFGVLAGKLRVDRRVVVFERTNISDLSPHHLKPPPSLATLDLSYISLRKAIPIVAKLLEPEGEMICLVKPLFEIKDASVRRSGVISSPDTYTKILSDLIIAFKQLGLRVIQVEPSRLRGGKGTKEFFIRISKDRSIMAKEFNLEYIVGSTGEFP